MSFYNLNEQRNIIQVCRRRHHDVSLSQVLIVAAAVESECKRIIIFFLFHRQVCHTHTAVGLPPSSFPTGNVSPTWNGELYCEEMRPR